MLWGDYQMKKIHGMGYGIIGTEVTVETGYGRNRLSERAGSHGVIPGLQ